MPDAPREAELPLVEKHWGGGRGVNSQMLTGDVGTDT